MADLFIIAHVQDGGCLGLQPSSGEGFGSVDHAGNARLVIQVARADKSIRDLHPGVEDHKIADADTQRARFFGTGCA